MYTRYQTITRTNKLFALIDDIYYDSFNNMGTVIEYDDGDTTAHTSVNIGKFAIWQVSGDKYIILRRI